MKTASGQAISRSMDVSPGAPKPTTMHPTYPALQITRLTRPTGPSKQRRALQPVVETQVYAVTKDHS
jgi:hypothetical protein